MPADHSTTTDVSHPLDHCPRAVGIARHVAQEVLADWAMDGADAVVLVVSELVTNAVEHALPPLALHLRREGKGVWVGVTDGGPAPEEGVWTSSCTEDEHGRGLGIVEMLTDSHGEDFGPDGAATRWANFRAV